MEDERIEDSKEERKEDLNRINDEKEPKIFDVSEKRYNDFPCWPHCEPCGPTGDSSETVICTPDLSDDWKDCKPCSPIGYDQDKWERIQKKEDECWPKCKPCPPDGVEASDYDDGGK